MGVIRLILPICLASAFAQAVDLRGTAVIEKKLTRRNVTPAAEAYQRGVSVDLASKGAESSDDPLAFERSHVAIYVEAAPGNQPVLTAGTPVEIAAIEQRNREFQPDFVVIPAGSSVSFPNFDPIFHNVFSLSKPKSFDLGNYPEGQTKLVRFANPGIVIVSCHLHPNMGASIVVSPTRWCARTDTGGHFELTGLPPGKYTVVAWHKTAGFFRQTVTVTDAYAPEIRFVIPFEVPSEEKSGQHAHVAAR